jgi:hypothetical protein
VTLLVQQLHAAVAVVAAGAEGPLLVVRRAILRVWRLLYDLECLRLVANLEQLADRLALESGTVLEQPPEARCQALP